MTPAGSPSATPAFQWSPDKKLIAFDGWLYDARGVTPRAFSGACVSPTWSPDGQSVVCYNNVQLVRYTRIGTNPIPLGIAGTLPDLSNDGTMLTYLFNNSVYVATANGTGAVAINPALENPDAPRWRP